MIVSPISVANPSRFSRARLTISSIANSDSKANLNRFSAFDLACSCILQYCLIVGSPGCLFCLITEPILFDGLRENHFNFNYRRDNSLMPPPPPPNPPSWPYPPDGSGSGPTKSTNPPLPYPISEMDISRWKHSGYLRYIARQERLACVQINR